MHFKSRIAVEAAVSAAGINLQAGRQVVSRNGIALRLRTVVVLLTLFAYPLLGGVVLDGSFGTHGALPGPNFMITAPMGKQVGGNLFQSFSQFNLNNSQSATFTGPSNVQNILARVTSGSPSSIDGTINSSIPGANLFFLNPAGVMFGSHAQVNVSGSFAVTTANYLKLAGGGRFNANLGGGDVLTSAPVSAFGFLNSAPAGVSISNATLSVASGKSFSIIAGDITLDGTQLSAPGGNLSLFSARSSGEVVYDPSNPGAHFRDSNLTAFGNITLKGAATAAIDSPEGGGKVTMRGGHILVTDSSTVSSINEGVNVGGDIELTADSLSLLKGGRIEAEATSDGAGGNLSIQSTNITVDGDDDSRFSAIRCTAQSGMGDAGKLVISTSNLTVSNGATISGDSFSEGRGADVNITANTIDIFGLPTASGLSSGLSGILANAIGPGNGGDIHIDVKKELRLSVGGIIDAATFSSGNGGNIGIHAGSLTVDSSGQLIPGVFVTGISTQSAEGSGNAGSVNITVDRALRVINGGIIETNTYTSGDGGNISIHAGSLLVAGSPTPDFVTIIGTDSAPGATGHAGDLTIIVDEALRVVGGFIETATFSNPNGGNLSIEAGSVSIGNGGIVDASTLSSGNGGNVTVNAGSIFIDNAGQPPHSTGIFADAFDGTGNGGNVAVNAQSVLLQNGGSISAESFTSGTAGSVRLDVGTLTLESRSAVSSANTSSGAAGSVFIQTLGPMEVSGGSSISTSAIDGGAGTVTVNAPDLTIARRGSISSSTLGQGNGGKVDVTADSLLIDGPSSGIFATAESGSSGKAGEVAVQAGDLRITTGGQISSSTSGTGNGGDVTVTADSLLIDGTTRPDLDTGISVASNEDATGDAGNLTISVDKLLNISRGGIISARTFSSGKGGDVILHAGSLSIDDSMTAEFHTGIFLDSDSQATGDAGHLTITVDNLLSIVGPLSQISVKTSSSGKGGDVTIHAGSLLIDGLGSPDFEAGIFADSGATGDAGNLTITVDKMLSIVGGGLISAATFSSGQGGDVKVHARSLSIDGGSGISADTRYSTGDGGNLTVTVDKLLTIAGGGQISARTFDSSGNAGDVTVHSGSVLIDGSAISPEVHETGIFVSSGSENPNATGNAGNLTITVDKLLSIVGTGRIAADTFSNGEGGNISIHAGSLSIDGSATAPVFTGIEADSSEGATGDAGNVTINVDGALSVAGSGGITAATFTNGNGGNLIIDAGSLLIDGSATPFATGIFATSYGSGDAGNIEIHAGSLTIDGSGAPGNDVGIFAASYGSGEAEGVFVRTTGPVKLKHGATISTTSHMTDAGSIDITAGGEVKLKDQSNITVSAGHNGGDINIMTPDLVYLLNSSITATAGSNGRSGAGGNITIEHPQFIVLQNSFISANAAIGQGGNIKLVSDFLFNSDVLNSNITATGTTNGTVNITAPVLDLGSELITLPVSLLSAESQLQERCTALLRGDFSSFISIGRGGTEPAPEELQSTF